MYIWQTNKEQALLKGQCSCIRGEILPLEVLYPPTTPKQLKLVLFTHAKMRGLED